ncbi:MAG: DUF131 domain-containing protein [Candidatus Micrarchaeia archaeon]
MHRELLFAGIALVLLGFALVAAAALFSKEAEYGGVVLLGPIPIVFGSSARAVFLAVLLAVLLVLIYFMFWLLKPLG